MTDPKSFPNEDELPSEVPDLTDINPFNEDPSEYEDINKFVKDDWP